MSLFCGDRLHRGLIHRQTQGCVAVLYCDDAPEIGAPCLASPYFRRQPCRQRSLVEGLRLGGVRNQPITTDRFWRTIAVIWAGKVNLSCWQLQRAQAVYKSRWDNRSIIARACR